MIFENEKYNYLRNFSTSLKNKIVIDLKSEIRNSWKDVTANIIINEIDDLYVLYVSNVEKIKNYISEEKYNYLKKENIGMIIGYILFCKEKIKNIKYIEFCDTIISKCNILNQMIEKYHQRYKSLKYILPHESIYSARIYWMKYIQSIYNINNSRELEEFIKNNKLNVKWSFIFHAFDEINNINLEI
jgi:hypothetical protein